MYYDFCMIFSLTLFRLVDTKVVAFRIHTHRQPTDAGDVDPSTVPD
jgi:hypothetical protein